LAINIYKHLTPAGAGLKNGNDWDNAFDEPAAELWIEGAVVAGDILFPMEGAYLFDSDWNSSARAGTEVSPISIICVKAGTTNVGANITYDDWAIDDVDKPFFDLATFELRTGSYYEVRNLDLQGGDTRVLYLGGYCVAENCKVDQDAVAAAKFCVFMGSGSRLINNEFFSQNCDGVAGSVGNHILFNYFHDMTHVNSIALTIGNNWVVSFNIFDNCKLGINSVSRDYFSILNNTFYNCGQGFVETDGRWLTMINNLFVDCTTAISWGVQTDSNFFWNNHFWNNVADYNNIDETTVYQDYARLTTDPLLTTPGSDFSYQDGSPAIGVGMSIDKGVG